MTRKTQRRHEQGELSRRRILEATVTLAAERGYDGTSIALVTEATGLPASSVYWPFRNKDELFAETLEFSYRRWRESAPAWSDQMEDDDAGDVDTQIHRRLHRAAAAITQAPEFWRLGLMLALERRLIEPAARRRFLEVRHETRNGIAQWWRQVLAPAGQFDDETVMRLGRVPWIMGCGGRVARCGSRRRRRCRCRRTRVCRCAWLRRDGCGAC